MSIYLNVIHIGEHILNLDNKHLFYIASALLQMQEKSDAKSTKPPIFLSLAIMYLSSIYLSLLTLPVQLMFKICFIFVLSSEADYSALIFL